MFKLKGIFADKRSMKLFKRFFSVCMLSGLICGCTNVVPEVAMLKSITSKTPSTPFKGSAFFQTELASQGTSTSSSGYTMSVSVSKEDTSGVQVSPGGYKLTLDQNASK